jgi:hypothetical protein
MGGEVGAHDGDHHVGAADRFNGEAGVEDVRADEDLSLAGGRVVWCGAVHGPDLVAPPGGRLTRRVPMPPEAPKTVRSWSRALLFVEAGRGPGAVGLAAVVCWRGCGF